MLHQFDFETLQKSAKKAPSLTTTQPVAYYALKTSGNFFVLENKDCSVSKSSLKCHINFAEGTDLADAWNTVISLLLQRPDIFKQVKMVDPKKLKNSYLQNLTIIANERDRVKKIRDEKTKEILLAELDKAEQFARDEYNRFIQSPITFYIFSDEKNTVLANETRALMLDISNVLQQKFSPGPTPESDFHMIDFVSVRDDRDTEKTYIHRTKMAFAKHWQRFQTDPNIRILVNDEKELAKPVPPFEPIPFVTRAYMKEEPYAKKLNSLIYTIVKLLTSDELQSKLTDEMKKACLDINTFITLKEMDANTKFMAIGGFCETVAATFDLESKEEEHLIQIAASGCGPFFKRPARELSITERIKSFFEHVSDYENHHGEWLKTKLAVLKKDLSEICAQLVTNKKAMQSTKSVRPYHVPENKK